MILILYINPSGMIKGHGNDSYGFADSIIADFSTNVFYKGIPKPLEDHLNTSIQSVANYPEPDGAMLQSKIAEYHGICENGVLVTNGSTEAFYLIAHRFTGERSTVLTPSFAEYEDACRLFNHVLTFVPNDKPLQDLQVEPGLLWIGNPNNPDGKMISSETIKQFCGNNLRVTVIIDEAFVELCNGLTSFIPYIRDYKNLIIVRSLTKTFSVPGLRLGYLITNPELRNEIFEYKIPWSVNSLAMEGGCFIMDHYESLLPDRITLVELSRSFQNQLNGIDGLEVTRSDCNFFLVRLLKGSAKKLKEYLLNNYNLLIRDASNFQGLNESFFRLSTQDEKHNQLLIAGIKSWLKSIY